MDNNTCECYGSRHKKRSEEELRELNNRLSRIEGQVRGVKRMLERDAYCTDIITQVAAINAALNSFNKKLLENHINSCVTSDIQNGNFESRDELVELLSKLMG
ncbi:MAG: metal-sensing transcriptional repressor [Ruminococcaceae bacterium]|nr:metal-sensing transcriptional repressor [Oscillospiraceae bacterium]